MVVYWLCCMCFIYGYSDLDYGVFYSLGNPGEFFFCFRDNSFFFLARREFEFKTAFELFEIFTFYLFVRV